MIHTREPELYPEITDAMLVELLADQPELLEPIRQLGLRSSMVVPLVARGRALGAITFVSAESGRRYTEAALAIALDLAHRAAVAVDNARLYREALQNERQVRFLAQAGALLGSSLDYDATLTNLARLSVPEVADWCIVDVVEGTQIRRVAVASAEQDQQSALEELRDRFPPKWDSPQPAARALREGGPVIFAQFDPGLLEQTATFAGKAIGLGARSVRRAAGAMRSGQDQLRSAGESAVVEQVRSSVDRAVDVASDTAGNVANMARSQARRLTGASRHALGIGPARKPSQTASRHKGKKRITRSRGR